jgi:hypothetical protein
MVLARNYVSEELIAPIIRDNQRAINNVSSN